MSLVAGIVTWVAGKFNWRAAVLEVLLPGSYTVDVVEPAKVVERTPEPVAHDAELTAERIRRSANQCLLWPVTNTDRRRKLWCGPTVVSTLIGIDAAAARDIIKQSRGGRAVMGTSARELDLVFRAHGCRLDLLTDHSSDLPTFASWLRLPRDPDHPLVIEVTGHWVAVRGNWFCDTFTKGHPVKVRHAPHKRKRVRRVYRVSRA